MVLAAGLLHGLARRTEVMFADGLRYVAQAQAIAGGSWGAALARSADHPLYPFAIAVLHRLAGGSSPAAWQAEAQGAAVLGGVLLVIPIYLFAFELYGGQVAWLACVLTFLVPLISHVFADALAESTFLFFWTTGCWAALRFLRQGRMSWLAAAVGMAALAYLTRPEGLLLPLALVGTLFLMVLVPPARWPWQIWIRAVSFLLVGPLLLVGPYMAVKGGVGTKPAVGRLLGLAARSHALAVERERPLDPRQSTVTTYLIAGRSAFRSIAVAVPPPYLLLAILSFLSSGSRRGWSRPGLFLGCILGGWLLALIRLHATSGYCTPRHTLIFALPVIAAGAHGLNLLVNLLASRLVAPSAAREQARVRVAALAACLGMLIVVQGRALGAPINPGFRGYRQAGEWLATHTPHDARVLDLKGWALFYGGRSGYTFDELPAAERDHELSWVVAHDSLLMGPWFYCDTLRRTVGGRSPVQSFPPQKTPGIAQVHIFKVTGPPPRTASSSTSEIESRRQ